MLWRPCYYRGLILKTLPILHIAFTSHHSCKLHTSVDFRDHTGEERKANSLDLKVPVVPSQRPKKRTKKSGQSQCASLNLPLLLPLQPDPQLLFPSPLVLFNSILLPSHNVFSRPFFSSLLTNFQNFILLPSLSPSIFWETCGPTYLPDYRV